MVTFVLVPNEEPQNAVGSLRQQRIVGQMEWWKGDYIFCYFAQWQEVAGSSQSCK